MQLSPVYGIEYSRNSMTQLLLNLFQLDKQRHLTAIFNNRGVSMPKEISSASSAKFFSCNFKFVSTTNFDCLVNKSFTKTTGALQ